MSNIERGGERSLERNIENVTLTANEVDEMLIVCREVTIVDVYRHMLHNPEWLSPEGKEAIGGYVAEHGNDHLEITGEK